LLAIWFRSQSEQKENRKMDAVIESLILDLVDWVAERERNYEKVIYAWRRSRSRRLIWEEANRRGLVTTQVVKGRCVVKPTSLGLILGELRRESRRQVRQSRSSATSSSGMMF
jgi:hypothetical protein